MNKELARLDLGLQRVPKDPAYPKDGKLCEHDNRQNTRGAWEEQKLRISQYLSSEHYHSHTPISCQNESLRIVSYFLNIIHRSSSKEIPCCCNLGPILPRANTDSKVVTHHPVGLNCFVGRGLLLFRELALFELEALIQCQFFQLLR